MTDQSRHDLAKLLATAAADVLEHSDGIITGFQIEWSQVHKGYMCKLYTTVNDQLLVAGHMFSLQDMGAVEAPEKSIQANLTDMFHNLHSTASSMLQ